MNPLPLLHLALAALAPPPCAPPLRVAEDCELSAEDAGWIELALDAWRDTARRHLRIESPPAPVAIFFDAHCTHSTEELGLDGSAPVWTTAPHGGAVRLPTGDSLPPVVASFAAPIEIEGETGGSFFAMSTPSVWRAGGVQSSIELPTFMAAVLVHEISHTAQVDTYMRRVSELEKAGDFGEDLTDDVLQDTFGSDRAIASAVAKETELLFRAAAAESEAEARELARRARESILERRASYRDRPLLQDLEDVFLTLEGAAQWAAFTWLRSPDGGAVDADTAMREFGRRTDRWSQRQGLALFLVVDRFVSDWPTVVYGAGDETALELLERALTP